jgi:hypothetical protein
MVQKTTMNVMSGSMKDRLPSPFPLCWINTCSVGKYLRKLEANATRLLKLFLAHSFRGTS